MAKKTTPVRASGTAKTKKSMNFKKNRMTWRYSEYRMSKLNPTASQPTEQNRIQLNSLFSHRMIVGKVSGVWPMWPPGKTRADLGLPYSSRM